MKKYKYLLLSLLIMLVLFYILNPKDKPTQQQAIPAKQIENTYDTKLMEESTSSTQKTKDLAEQQALTEDHNDIEFEADYFLLAKDLYQQAVLGNPDSQNRLANILIECEFAALYRDRLSDDIAMLKAMPQLIEVKVITLLEQLQNNCQSFHPSLISDFMMEPGENIPSIQLTDIAVAWKSEAAQSGLKKAIAELPMINPNMLADENMYNSFKMQVQEQDPAAIFSLGVCLQRNETNNTQHGRVLQDIACEIAGSCENLPNIKWVQTELLMSIFFTQHPKPNPQQRELGLPLYNTLNYQQFIKKQNAELLDYSDIKQNMRQQLSQTSSIEQLLKRCPISR